MLIYMKAMSNGILTLLLALVAQFTFAQSKTISGTVTDSSNVPLPGVNIIIDGTTNGTQSDFDGNFTIQASVGDVLVISYIGQKEVRITVGSSDFYSIQMEDDAQQLDEVVVTSLGLKREARSLGYAVAKVTGEDVQGRAEPDLIRAMQGKMTGVNITGGGGAPGQGTKINIRGMSSLTGNTQPLFIVDGIPFDNSVNATAGAGQNTVFSNRGFDLDPNSIESISVLKGAAASALYGSRATNGVVVITTKGASTRSRRGLEVTYNGSLMVTDISGIPDYQDVYTQGSNQVYNGGFIGNWGAPMPNHVDRINQEYGTNYTKTYALYPDGQPYPDGYASNPVSNRFPGVFPDLMQDYTMPDGSIRSVSAPYEIKANDIIGGFFQQGQTQDHAISLSGGSEKGNVNAGFSNTNQGGIVPNQFVRRTSFYTGGNATLDNGVTVSGTVNYVNTTQQSPKSGASAFNDYYGGGGGSIYARLFYLPRNFDLNGLPWENPADGSNIFYRALDNPIWIANNNFYKSDVNRAYGNITIGYDIAEGINVTLKGGINSYHDARRSNQVPGGIDTSLGQVNTVDVSNTERDFTALLNINKDLTDDITLTAVAGLNANERKLTQRSVTGNVVISRGLNITSATSTQIVDYDYLSLRRLYGVFADLSFGYKDMLYLGLVGRQDHSSTLPQGANSYFYPGASLSFLVSEAVDLPEFIGSLKLRVSNTKVGNDASPYRTRTNFSILNPFTSPLYGAINRATLGNTLGNSTLKPEFTTEFETGLAATLFNDRMSVDFTYFNRTSTEQIATASVARSSGFTSQVVNIGELNNKGIEIGLDVYPIASDNFTWNTYFAFTKIKSLVVDAGPNGEIFIGGPGSSLGTIHRNGLPYGQIFGTENAKAEDGTLLIDKASGLPFAASTSTVIGDPNPDFTLGITNSFKFKNLTLRALIDWREGGDMYSFTAASLMLRGQLANSVEREDLRVVPGVYGSNQTFQPILDASGNMIQNTTPITAFDSHFSDGWGAYGQDEVNIYDVTTIRLREVGLSYALPKSILDKTPFGSGSLGVSGRNLWWKAPNMLEGLNLDPEVLAESAASNVQGFEYGATPTTKSVSFNLSLTF
jgi:TonB-linked SusC/RagA family outer membrane protein